MQTMTFGINSVSGLVFYPALPWIIAILFLLETSKAKAG
jgi:hypothetical protein